MTHSLDKLRRMAKSLRRAALAGDQEAIARLGGLTAPKHSDALHAIAREEGHQSWPGLKIAVEAQAMDRTAKAERLKMAIFHGQHWAIERLLATDPSLGRDNFGLICALYDREAVAEVLARDPEAAVRPVGPRRPFLHLTYSTWFRASGAEADMFAVGEMLLAHGADVNDAVEMEPGSGYMLSALYGAIGHAHNLALAKWLLDKGADPNDGESLYHACEIGNAEGLRLLLAHGAKTERTNALPRALDFDDEEMVRVLLDGGADPNEGIHWPENSGESPFVIPALHQAARRMCSRRIVRMLLDAGARPDGVAFGHTPYAFARIFGNAAAAEEIAAAGGSTTLTPEEEIMAAAIEGRLKPGQRLDPEALPERSRDMVRNILHLPDGLAKAKALVGAGLPFDKPDGSEQLTPVQIAGWEGLPDAVEWLLSLGPDLSHVNRYGGTLLSTIIHGSENCPARAERDHVACARLALEAGVDLPRRAIGFAGDPDMAEFLADWAEAHPQQLTDEGPA